MKYLLCQVLVCVAAASSDHKKDGIINLRKLQDATRPPKTPPPTPARTRPPKTPPPTPARTRPPKTPPPTPSPTTTGPQSIAQTVCSDDEFFKLCSYLELTGLYETLNSDGTYTLFAPNDAAFEQLTILPGLSDEEIRGVLMYHVAPNVLTYKDLMSIAPGDIETMVPGIPIGVSTGFDDEVLLNGNTKITSDIQASNGIIQVIDQVLIPPIDTPTVAPSTALPTLNSTEVIAPDPTFEPTTASPVAQADTKAPTISPTVQGNITDTKSPTISPVAQVDTKTPTVSPTAQIVTKTPTSQPTSKPQTDVAITEPPTLYPTPFFSYGKETPYPTIHASIIDDFGTPSPTKEKTGVFASKSRKSSSSSGSKSSKSKTSKSKSSKSKSSKSYEVKGKSDKSSKSRSKYYATRDVSMLQAFGDEFSNARFRADFNASSLLHGGSGYYLSMVTLATAWYWLN